MNSRRFLAFVFLLLSLVRPEQAAAHETIVTLSERQCVGGADTAQEAFAIPLTALDCDAPSYSRPDRFVRGHARIEGQLNTAAIPRWWQSDPAYYDSMLIRFTFADGSQRLVDVDPQMPVRNWYAGDRFSVPVPERDSPLVAIDTVIERPQSTSTLADARLVGARSAAAAHFARTMVYALICGVLLVPLIYNLLFFRVLRKSFILWHGGMVVAMLAYVALSSGLVFLALPDLPQWVRWHGTYVALTSAVVFSAAFLVGVLERVVSQPWMRRLLVVALVPLIFIQLFMLFGGGRARMTIILLYEAALIPLLLAALTVICVAIGRDSRAARWMIFSSLGLVLAGVIRLLQQVGWVTLQFALDDFIFSAMVLLAIGTSLAVGDRFMVMKRDRDEARSEALRMGRMASTDPLTRLLNRRAFDTLGDLEEGRGLLVADIDRFKAINDLHGHPVGDAVLGSVAQSLRGVLQELDDAKVYRLGGEEFAATYPASDMAGLLAVCEDIRTRIADESNDADAQDLPPVTISVGAVLGRGQPMNDAFAEADSALYSAKAMGRNRSILYRHVPEDPSAALVAGQAGGGETPVGKG